MKEITQVGKEGQALSKGVKQGLKQLGALVAGAGASRS